MFMVSKCREFSFLHGKKRKERKRERERKKERKRKRETIEINAKQVI